MIKHLSVIFTAFLLSCATSPQESTFIYQNEESVIVRYNPTKTTFPLLIVISDVDGSLLDEEILKRLSKGYRVTTVSFLAHNNKVRQQQLDNLNNRTTFYSDQISLLCAVEKDSAIVLAEGLNANITAGIVQALPIKRMVLLNAYYPTLNDVFTTKCYAQKTNDCDSILHFMQFGYRYAVDSVLVAAAKPTRDNQYGRYATSYWKDILPLPGHPPHNLFKGTLKYVYTSNSGLAPTPLLLNFSITSKDKLKEALADAIRN